MTTAFLYDDLFLGHSAEVAHPERPERLGAIVAAIERRGAGGGGAPFRLERITARDARDDEILAAHSPRLLETLRTIDARGGGWIDSDTYLGSHSFAAARRAAGGVIEAAEAVRIGRASSAFCAVRPPGHHATRDRAMGFCLLNNIAIAARSLRMRGVARVFIFDWDVHHGNGTQDIFYDDPTVFYSSVHQSPLYPGTGSRDEIGEGEGEGFTLNIPLPPGSGDPEFLDATDKAIEAVRSFRPEVVLVSAGYDAHSRDPLAQCEVTSGCFGEMTRRIRGAADSVAGGRLVIILEGGYDLRAVAESARETVGALLEE